MAIMEGVKDFSGVFLHIGKLSLAERGKKLHTTNSL